jgi:hypothetical protein
LETESVAVEDHRPELDGVVKERRIFRVSLFDAIWGECGMVMSTPFKWSMVG